MTHWGPAGPGPEFRRTKSHAHLFCMSGRTAKAVRIAETPGTPCSLTLSCHDSSSRKKLAVGLEYKPEIEKIVGAGSRMPINDAEPVPNDQSFQYEDRAIAFLDILGWKNACMSDSPTEAMMNAMRHVSEIPKLFSQEVRIKIGFLAVLSG